MIVNHLMYADDIVLIAPSSLGLMKLLETCQQFEIENDIEFNSTKSAILPFLPEDKKKFMIPTFYLRTVYTSFPFRFDRFFFRSNLFRKTQTKNKTKKSSEKCSKIAKN